MIIITSTAKQTMRNSNVFLAIAGFSTTTTTAFAPFLGNSRGTLETKTLSAAWQHVQTTTCRASTTRTSTSLRATMPSLSSHCEDDLPLAREAMAFIDASPDPFHVVKKAVEKLEEVGFVEWSDDEEIENGGEILFHSQQVYTCSF